MINRVFLFVVDGLGVGATEDAGEYGDTTAHTLAHIAEAAGGLNLPTLESLGLGHVSEIRGVRSMAQPIGCFGRLGFKTKGVDSLVGHWEIAGCLSDEEGTTFTEGYPTEVVEVLKQVYGRKLLGCRVASCAESLRVWGSDHLSSGAPIVWSDGRQTCVVAAHHRIMQPDELCQRARDARKTLKDRWGLRRVVAQPLEGAGETLSCGSGRRDFAGEPPGQTMLDQLNRAGQILIGVGKVGDLFGGRGLTRTAVASTWSTAMDEVNGMFHKVPRGLIFAALEIVGHDANQSAALLQDFDRRLQSFLDQLRPGDLWILTGDHGRDPKKPHSLPTREFVPLLVTGPKLAQGVNFGKRESAADVGQTIIEALRGDSLAVGESFLDALRPG